MALLGVQRISCPYHLPAQPHPKRPPVHANPCGANPYITLQHQPVALHATPVSAVPSGTSMRTRPLRCQCLQLPKPMAPVAANSLTLWCQKLPTPLSCGVNSCQLPNLVVPIAANSPTVCGTACCPTPQPHGANVCSPPPCNCPLLPTPAPCRWGGCRPPVQQWPRSAPAGRQPCGRHWRQLSSRTSGER